MLQMLDELIRRIFACDSDVSDAPFMVQTDSHNNLRILGLDDVSDQIGYVNSLSIIAAERCFSRIFVH
uniref:Transposase n=1 Tax=Syphacia muris TaxID=451379 RepID=A0A0N5AF08_9BILA